MAGWVTCLPGPVGRLGLDGRGPLTSERRAVLLLVLPDVHPAALLGVVELRGEVREPLLLLAAGPRALATGLDEPQPPPDGDGRADPDQEEPGRADVLSEELQRPVVELGREEPADDGQGTQRDQEQTEDHHAGTVTLRPRAVGEPERQDTGSRSTSSRRRAPPLSSGLFWFPHLGDCTHEGQPSKHSQAAMVSRVAVSQWRAAAKPRSAKPAPPGWPS